MISALISMMGLGLRKKRKPTPSRSSVPAAIASVRGFLTLLLLPFRLLARFPLLDVRQGVHEHAVAAEQSGDQPQRQSGDRKELAGVERLVEKEASDGAPDDAR